MNVLKEQMCASLTEVLLVARGASEKHTISGKTLGRNVQRPTIYEKSKRVNRCDRSYLGRDNGRIANAISQCSIIRANSVHSMSVRSRNMMIFTAQDR